MELLMQHTDRANRVKQVDGHAGWSSSCSTRTGPTESSRWRDTQDGAPDAAHGPAQQSQAGGGTRRMELLMQHTDRPNRVKHVDGHAGWSS
ncbi:hypothetical protein CgunFtcFv8_004868 [Champsocephalus gunnari]|uniref:Uncharacterized protein n=1 Tax=Champsocephalus gunnari TaxID=52237 RepID=A0AAN8E251_CHAGU|nr:hypothetical protein CgunFtcFv8_004868 [Champsocephalus gunnari]